MAAPADAEPDAVLAARETIELAFLAALQHLPPRQRAILILSDVVGWSAAEVAEMLELTVASVTSALQRAHATMRAQLPAGRPDWAPGVPVTADERAALKTFMDAWEQGDTAELTRLLREDARWAMPPAPLWFDGPGGDRQHARAVPAPLAGARLQDGPDGRQPTAGGGGLPAPGRRVRLPPVGGPRAARRGRRDRGDHDLLAELCAGFQLPPTL